MIKSLQELEYPSTADNLYLDHAGAALVSQSVVSEYSNILINNIHGNPHSNVSPSAQHSLERINMIRFRILKYFNVSPDTYSVIFTSSATAALKKLGESIDWKKNNGLFSYLQQSHTSVLGIREFLLAAGKSKSCIFPLSSDRLLNSLNASIPVNLSTSVHTHFNLFAFPAQCNFSGERFPLDWITKIQTFGIQTENDYPWKVLVDAASYLSASPLNLDKFPADFVVLSFYKIFGFPTGVGALIVKNDSLPFLSKSYFGGGTVSAVSWDSCYKSIKPNVPEMFEDGTLPFLEILSIDCGFNYIENIGGWKSVHDHVFEITNYTRAAMKNLQIETKNGPLSLCEIYPKSPTKNEIGPIIAFNIKNHDGAYVGYNHVSKLASLAKIHLRVGCFCNPGACSAALQLSSEQVQKNKEVLSFKSCGDDIDIIDGKPVGAIRISFGISNTMEDAYKWILFLKENFLKAHPIPHILKNVNTDAKLSRIVIYPIKSCGGYTVTEWNISRSGLYLDRHWMLVDDQGKAWDQKRLNLMALIKPFSINLNPLKIELRAPGWEPLILTEKESFKSINTDFCQNKTESNYHENLIENAWFSKVLGVSCRLVSCNYKRNTQENINDSVLSFANESQFLLINESSVAETINRIEKRPTDIDISCFRANFIIETKSNPFIEDDWIGKKIIISNQIFRVLGPCQRCTMICINQATAYKSSEPFTTLSKFRKVGKHINFGVHLLHERDNSINPHTIKVGAFLKLM